MLTPELRTPVTALRSNPPLCERCRLKLAKHVTTRSHKPRSLCGDCKVTEGLHRGRAAVSVFKR